MIDRIGDEESAKAFQGLLDDGLIEFTGERRGAPERPVSPIHFKKSESPPFSALLTQWGPQRERALAGFGRKSRI